MAAEQGNVEQRADQRNLPGPQPALRAGEEPKPAEPRHRVTLEADEPGSAGLDQIREILFGATHHEFERRLVRTDAHLAARSQELEQEARRRSEVLEQHFEKEVEAIASRVERGLAEIGEGLRKLSRDQRSVVEQLEQRLTKVEQQSALGQRDVRRDMLDQAKSFLDELQRLRKELFATLQHELGLAERELMEELHETAEHPGH